MTRFASFLAPTGMVDWRGVGLQRIVARGGGGGSSNLRDRAVRVEIEVSDGMLPPSALTSVPAVVVQGFGEMEHSGSGCDTTYCRLHLCFAAFPAPAPDWRCPSTWPRLAGLKEPMALDWSGPGQDGGDPWTTRDTVFSARARAEG